MKTYIVPFITFISLITITGCSKSTEQKTLTGINPTTKQVIQNNSIKRVYTEVNRKVYSNYPSIQESADFIWIIQPLKPFNERTHVSKRGEYNALVDYHTKTKAKVLKVFKWEVTVGDVIEIIEPITIIDSSTGGKIKISTDKYDELPYEVPSLTFLHKNSYGKLWIWNAQNSYFPMQKTQTFTRDGTVKADKIVQNRKWDKIHQAIYDGIIKDWLLNK